MNNSPTMDIQEKLIKRLNLAKEIIAEYEYNCKHINRESPSLYGLEKYIDSKLLSYEREFKWALEQEDF